MTHFRLFSKLQQVASLVCFFLLWLLPIYTTAQIKFFIDGRIDNSAGTYSKNNINDGDIIILNFINLVRKDTVVIKNNTYHIEGEVPYPSVVMIEYKHGGSLILLDSSHYQYDLVLEKVDSTHWTYDPDVATKSTFHNTWLNFYEYKGRLLQLRNQLNETAQHSINPDSTLYYGLAIKAANKKIAAAYHQFAADHPNSYIAAYVLQGAPDFSYANYIDVFNSFSDQIKNSFYGKNFYSRMLTTKEDEKEGVTVQSTAGEGMFPVTRTIDTAFNKILLDNAFFSKHKYTLIEFWASWCGPCRRVNENMKKMTQAFKDKDVELVGFSLDQAAEAWKVAMLNDKLPWLQVSDLKAANSPLVEYLKLEVIPANVLVDRGGKIVGMNIYDGELEGFLKGVN